MELAARFLKHAKAYYTKPDGTQSREASNFNTVLKLVINLYGDTFACAFGPRALKTVRTKLIERALARSTINQAINRLRRIFRWSAEEELVDASLYHALQTVKGLQRGRSVARETEPVAHTSRADVNSTFSQCSPHKCAVAHSSKAGSTPLSAQTN